MSDNGKAMRRHAMSLLGLAAGILVCPQMGDVAVARDAAAAIGHAGVTGARFAQAEKTLAPAPANAPAPAAPAPTPAAPTPAAPAPSAAAPASPPAAPAAKAATETPAIVMNGQQVVSILSKKVRGADGTDMGRIVDIIADKSGQLRAAIIDFGGFLGVGSRQIAVDWNAIRFPPDGKPADSVEVDLTRDQLRGAPAYKPGEQIVVLGKPSTVGAQTTKPSAAAAPPAEKEPPSK